MVWPHPCLELFQELKEPVVFMEGQARTIDFLAVLLESFCYFEDGDYMIAAQHWCILLGPSIQQQNQPDTGLTQRHP
jgi:hypothetical protein